MPTDTTDMHIYVERALRDDIAEEARRERRSASSLVAVVMADWVRQRQTARAQEGAAA